MTCPCGSEIEARGEKICTDCLDELRRRDREADYDDYLEHLQEIDSLWSE